jgi:predicted enzyme related to lactoylglutathione lyase
MHLRLPGHGDEGPTLELFTYSGVSQRLTPRVNRPGYGHLAFQVDSVADARRKILAAGGGVVGNVVTLTTATGSRVTWCYVTDPEGNILELQSWEPPD